MSMVKMEKQSNLQVTFSKRRAGLFKKASELCTLCGAEAAIVVFSPAEKAYCFGHPNLKTLLDRLSEGVEPPPSDPRSQLVMEAHRNSTIRQLNMELTQAEGLLRAEKRRAKEIEADKMTCPSLDGFSYAQLSVLQDSIMAFKNKLDAKVQKQMAAFSENALPFHNPEKTDNISAGLDNATKLSLGSSEPGFYSNGGLIAPGSSTYSNVAITSSDHDYGTFNFVGGSGFSLGHDLRPGFF